MPSLKGAFEVRAGVVPTKPEKQFTKQWFYTGDDYEADAKRPQAEPTTFARLRDEAYEYAKGLTDPARLNWVEVTWVWY